jgi:hypothetical protein
MTGLHAFGLKWADMVDKKFDPEVRYARTSSANNSAVFHEEIK